MNYLEQKLNALYRYILWHNFSKKLNLLQVVEYPKSGGTWMTQIISDYLNLYYPRNVIPKFKQAVIHGHYLYSKKFNKIVFVTRDGRDIMVSYYFHMLVGNDRTPDRIIKNNRKKMPFNDYENIKKNLPYFIEYLHTDYLKKFNRFSLADFINSYNLGQENVILVKYEDMLKNIELELSNVLLFLGETEIDQDRLLKTTEKFSFKNQTKRKPGQEDKNSFLRKGIAGDWKNNFNIESAQVFEKYLGKTLIDLGYENNNEWVNYLNN
ncbi:MAG: hypothetical protein HKO92_05040 [Flavobacteriaceae bacterium]|nr:sulfotransferase domain-containing protein [Bacteroidia bacterium]NNK82467.1 hypothetical protein [Flavobacteriaceae bacterium]